MSMANKDQEEIWNGPGGKAWVRAQALLDAAFTPFERILVETATAAGAARVLDPIIAPLCRQQAGEDLSTGSQST